MFQRFFFEGVPPRLLGVTALVLLADDRGPEDAATCLPAAELGVLALLLPTRTGR